MSKMRRLGPSVLAVVLVITLASLNGAQATTGAVDQQCSTIGGSYLDGVGVHQPAGQTFIPTQSSMTALALYLWSDNPTSTSMTANVISDGVAGVNGIEGNLVGSVTFTVPALFGQLTGAWLKVPLPSGIVLTPGVVYAVALVDNSGSGGIKWSACSTPYSNGCGYANGQCQASSWAFIDYYGDFLAGFLPTGISIAQGASGTVNLYVTSLDSFASPVSLTYSAPPGVTASFNGPSQVETSAGGTSSPTVTIYVAGTTPPGTYPFTVRATSGGISHSAKLQLIVTPSPLIVTPATPPILAPVAVPDFSISSISQPLPPAIMTLTPDVSESSTIVLSSVNGYSSSVSLTAAWTGTAPDGVAVSLSSPVTVPAGSSVYSTLTLTADNSPSTGSYALTVTATNGVVAHSTQISVIIAGTPAVLAPVTPLPAVGTADFSINPVTNTMSVSPGQSVGTSLIVNSLGGFSSPVTFSVSWVGTAPSGISITLPQSVTPPASGKASTPIAFTTASGGSKGDFVAQVTATSGSVTHSADITLFVNSPGT